MLALLVSLLMNMNNPDTSSLVYDFSTGGTEDWATVLDGVMGGRSSGFIRMENDLMVFSGVLSLENNGGFSSVRSPWKSRDLRAYTTARIRVKGDGRTYALGLENGRFPTPYYTWEFSTVEGRWLELELNLRDFRQKMVGRETGRTISEDQLGVVQRVGITLSDKKPGPFQIEIDYIAFLQQSIE